MIKNLLKLLRKLKNLFINNIEDLKTIKEKNRILEIKKVKDLLETLEMIKTNCEQINSFLNYNKGTIQQYYPTLTNEDTKLLFNNKLKHLEEQFIQFRRIMILFLKLESRFNEKLEKLLAKEDIENNYALTKEVYEEFTLFGNMYMEFDQSELKNDFYEINKILNIDLEND